MAIYSHTHPVRHRTIRIISHLFGFSVVGCVIAAPLALMAALVGMHDVRSWRLPAGLFLLEYGLIAGAYAWTSFGDIIFDEWRGIRRGSRSQVADSCELAAWAAGNFVLTFIIVPGLLMDGFWRLLDKIVPLYERSILQTTQTQEHRAAEWWAGFLRNDTSIAEEDIATFTNKLVERIIFCRRHEFRCILDTGGASLHEAILEARLPLSVKHLFPKSAEMRVHADGRTLVRSYESELFSDISQKQR